MHYFFFFLLMAIYTVINIILTKITRFINKVFNFVLYNVNKMDFIQHNGYRTRTLFSFLISEFYIKFETS